MITLYDDTAQTPHRAF